jgi:hypothetical protein
VEDTVLDLIGAARSFDDAYGWISAAVGRRLTTPELLGKALAARSRMRWRARLTAALQDAADGVHSPLERNYVHGVERAHSNGPRWLIAGQTGASQSGLGGAGGVPLGGSLGPRGYLGLRLGGGLRGGGLGRRHQGLEQPGVVAVFGIPLHA